MRFERKRILITVKAYPNPSTKYGETICCAGVDLNNSQLVRLYPISYRDLDSEKKLKNTVLLKLIAFHHQMTRGQKAFESIWIQLR